VFCRATAAAPPSQKELEYILFEAAGITCEFLWNSGAGNATYRKLMVLLDESMYGRMALDDNGNLEILYVGEYKELIAGYVEEYRAREGQVITMIPAKFSRRELNAVRDRLNDNYFELKINTMMPTRDRDVVVVTFLEEDFTEENIQRVKDFVGIDCLKFEIGAPAVSD